MDSILSSDGGFMAPLIIVAASMLFIVLLGMIFSKLYVKATKDKAFIKTG